MNKQDKFKPYVPHEKKTSELTLASVITGIVLAIVFGASNAYLGLRVGITVSASIPAAVLAMGIIRVVLRRNSVLESNIVQTIGSAGESVAAGAIFTLPALFLWAAEGKTEKPDIFEITIIALIGGLLGVFFMIPLRNALIVKEHKNLPYPEGSACAEVLLAGEKTSNSSSTVFKGMGLGAVLKFIVDGLKLVKSEISFKTKFFAGEIGTQVYPAVLSVGYICGPKISGYLFSGGVLSWLVIIPLIVLFGENSYVASESFSIGEIFSQSGAGGIWSTHIRYIGAGALAAGGIISLIKTLPLILKTFAKSVNSIALQEHRTELRRTEKDINMKLVLISIALLTVFMWLVPAVPISFAGAVMVVVFGFFFAAVSSRMVGLVGSSNNPISGMAIATLLAATLILKLSGVTGIRGMVNAIAIGSVICIISAIAGDTSQDLKTGFILGATPKKQQIGEIIGVVCSALAIGATLYLLDLAWGFGSDELAAPQATLMKIITEGVMEGSLPWTLVLCGVFITVFAHCVRIPVLPFAIGVYLPIHLTSCIMIGGLIRWTVEKITKHEDDRKIATTKGTLFCSGLIAGEGIVGIALALLAVMKVDSIIDLSSYVSPVVSFGGAIVLLVLTAALLIFSCVRIKQAEGIK
ncbi:MAG: oligopeptide transporter, OPT family [Clostridia bacterium]|nr:oligopeptide transporter, OPT family [Clostridia bacterium]